MKHKILIASLLSVSTLTFAASSIEGSYKCQGTDPYTNKNYTGTVTISASSNAIVNPNLNAPVNPNPNAPVNAGADASDAPIKAPEEIKTAPDALKASSDSAAVGSEAVFQLSMNYETGEKSLGTGFLDNNLLSVVFQDTASADKIGLQHYTYSEATKELKGNWVYLGKDKVGQETCVKM